MCVDPCGYHQCAQGQNCHVDNHQPVCVHTGKFYWPNIFYPISKCSTSTRISGRDPYDCSHCSGGVCDPLTGACNKGNFDCSLKNVEVLRILLQFIFNKLTKLGILIEYHKMWSIVKIIANQDYLKMNRISVNKHKMDGKIMKKKYFGNLQFHLWVKEWHKINFGLQKLQSIWDKHPSPSYVWFKENIDKKTMIFCMFEKFCPCIYIYI